MKYCEENEIGSQLIWYNADLTIGKKLVYNKSLFDCGMWFIKDLYSNGDIIPFQVWKERGAKTSDYLLWRGIVQAVKQKNPNRINIFEDDCTVTCGISCNDKFTGVLDIDQKLIKNVLRSQKYEQCNGSFKSKTKYVDKFGVQEDEWRCIYLLAKEITMDNKLFEMQFKIIHRITGTNKLLYRIGKIASPVCSRSEMYTETIEHIFFECIVVKNFLLKLTDLWNEYMDNGINISFTCKEILLGYDVKNWTNCIAEDILIMYAKKYIYACKMNEKNPEIRMFKYFMQSNMNIIRQTNFKFNIECMNILNVITDFM